MPESDRQPTCRLSRARPLLRERGTEANRDLSPIEPCVRPVVESHHFSRLRNVFPWAEDFSVGPFSILPRANDDFAVCVCPLSLFIITCIMMSSPPLHRSYLSWDILRPCFKCCSRLWVCISVTGRAQAWPASSGVETTERPLADGYLQINELAIFGECVGAVAWIPTILALLFPILRYGLRPAWNRRGIWLRGFAAEEPGEAEGISTDLIPIKKRTWSAPAILLILSSTVGLVISILAALNPGAGPLFSTPLIPHVSTFLEPVSHQAGTNLEGGCHDCYTIDRKATVHPRTDSCIARRVAARPARHVQHYPAGLLQVWSLDLGN